MRKSKILLFSVLGVLIMVSSCKKDDPVVQAEELVKYIETSITPATIPAYITASDLDDKITAQTNMLIVDIRSANDYAAGHITGAVNVPDHKLLLQYLETNSVAMDKEIYVVCYSGQSAAWSTALIRVAGYTNAKSLKFGMSSWSTEAGYDKWTGKISDDYFSSMVQTASPAKPAAGNLPSIDEGSEDGEAILDARLDKIFAEGFTCTTDAATVMGGLYDNPNYFIINFWSEEHYLVGHIPNSVNYEPAEDPFTLAKDLKTLPTDKTIVVYCYTGQTSAYMAAYLRLLGYDAKTLTFGANSMMYDHMPASKWTAPTVSRTLVTSK
ncbi:MAG: rhodanese-like domain-containing protein [Marinilabiliaceae bacterium]|jgi:rhodanese-related sulfurtransferase|nr:rhodanese-like domain-containing protein [Marinilabiliaceae bacterium]